MEALILLIALLSPTLGWSAIAANTDALYDFENGAALGTDTSGNGLTLTNNGSTPQSTTAKVGNYSAGPFTGSTYFSSPAGLDTKMNGKTVYTIEFYVKMNAGFASCAPYVITNGNSYCVIGNNGFIQWLTAGATLDSAPGKITAGAWQHIALVMTGAAKQIWVDGIVVTGTAYSSTLGTANAFPIGSFGGIFNIQGLIDQMRFSNVARTTFPTVDPADTVVTPPDFSPFLRNLLTPFLGPMGFR
jgi:hypothetical protein